MTNTDLNWFANYIKEFRQRIKNHCEIDKFSTNILVNKFTDLIVEGAKELRHGDFDEKAFRDACQLPATEERTQGGSIELRGSRLEVKTPFFIGGKGNGLE